MRQIRSRTDALVLVKTRPVHDALDDIKNYVKVLKARIRNLPTGYVTIGKIKKIMEEVAKFSDFKDIKEIRIDDATDDYMIKVKDLSDPMAITYNESVNYLGFEIHLYMNVYVDDEMIEDTPTEKPEPPEREAILRKAIQTVCHDRQNQYGKPENSFRTIAYFWDDYIFLKYPEVFNKFHFTPEDVSVMMALQKISRQISGQGKMDNFVDACGYMGIAGELWDKAHDEYDEPLLEV